MKKNLAPEDTNELPEEKDLLCLAVAALLNEGEPEIAIASALGGYTQESIDAGFLVICDWSIKNGLIDLALKIMEICGLRITDEGAETVFTQCLKSRNFEKALLALPLFSQEKQGGKRQALLNKVLDQERFDLARDIASGLEEKLLDESIRIQFDFLLEQRKFCKAGRLLSLVPKRKLREYWPELLRLIKREGRVTDYLKVCASLEKATTNRDLATFVRSASKRNDLEAAIAAAKAMQGQTRHLYLLDLMGAMMEMDLIDKARDLARELSREYFSEELISTIRGANKTDTDGGIFVAKINCLGEVLN